MSRSHNLQRLIREYVHWLPHDMFVQEHKPNDKMRRTYIRTWFLAVTYPKTRTVDWHYTVIFTDKSIIFSHSIVSTYYTSMLRALIRND